MTSCCIWASNENQLFTSFRCCSQLLFAAFRGVSRCFWDHFIAAAGPLKPRQDDPTDPAAWNNRGNALLALGRFEEAKDSFQQALDISGAPKMWRKATLNKL